MIEDIHTNKSLFLRIANDDEQAFRLLFEQFTPKILRYVWNMVKSKVIAEELVQDCFLKIWAGRAGLAKISNPDNYIFIIARNLVMDHFRRASVDARIQEAAWSSIGETQNTTQETVDVNESRRLITLALDQLSEHKQRIFKMSRYEGLTHEQIAEKLGISKSTVKNHLVESLKHIREFLNKHTDPMVVLVIMHFLYA